jgi:hypothetical protein
MDKWEFATLHFRWGGYGNSPISEWELNIVSKQRKGYRRFEAYNAEDVLPELGEDGWELVSVVPQHDHYKYWLKRKIIE